MVYPESAVPVWFGRNRLKDIRLLDQWRSAPLTFFPDQEIDANWNVDHYEVVLGRDTSGDLFQRAAALTLRNRFYPPQVLVSVSDFDVAGRLVQPGDRVVQRIRIFQPLGLPVLEVLTMNEITEVIQEPRRAGFTYTTVAAHSEVGEWSPVVEWRENGEVVLAISVVSRSRADASPFSRSITRRLQLRAHKLSIQNFRAQLSGEWAARPEPRTANRARLIPAMLMAIAGLLFLSAMLGLGRRNKRAQ